MSNENVLSLSTFADLCPDILLHIFGYFSANELFQIFDDFLPYLPTLLLEGHVKLYIDQNADKQFWNDFLRRISRQQIIALNIPLAQINEINLLQFPLLRSIVLEDIRWIKQLNHLMYLERLSLNLSERIFNQNNWLSPILQLPVLKQFKIDVMKVKNTISLQRDIQISSVGVQSLTIKYLHIKIPLLWTSILTLLEHFPVLEIFHASLYPIKSSHSNILLSKPNLTCFQSLQILHLTGYFASMSSVITYFCSSISTLKTCRLMSTSATNDKIIPLIRLRQNFFWNQLFQSCKDLTHVKIHLLLSLELQKPIDLENLKDLIRSFNDNAFCQQYHLYMTQTSIRNGYVTFMCDFNKRLV